MKESKHITVFVLIENMLPAAVLYTVRLPSVHICTLYVIAGPRLLYVSLLCITSICMTVMYIVVELQRTAIKYLLITMYVLFQFSFGLFYHFVRF